ncbi:MAG: hypothetical protein ACI4HM_07570 [Ruminococcus sp.]
MNLRKQLKKDLGERYCFKRYMSAGEVKKKLYGKAGYEERLVATLTVGCVKINAVIYFIDEEPQIGLDVLVKDTPESEEWICYDTLPDEIKLSPRAIGQSMFDILNREVKEYGLSYTECNFEVINGKVIK